MASVSPLLPGGTSTMRSFGTATSWSTTTVSTVVRSATKPVPEKVPPLLHMLKLFFERTNDGFAGNRFFTSATAPCDFDFTAQRPIIGVDRHFVVYASPFDDKDQKPETTRDAEIYCVKAPNLASGQASSSSHDARAFRDEFYDTVLQELRVLCHPCLSNHENVINLFGLDFYEDPDDQNLPWPVLLTEYAAFGTLDSFQEDMGCLQPDLSRQLLLDVALGLKSLHSCNIIHGDVKSENVLVCTHPTRTYTAKVCDFGQSLINPQEDVDHQLPGGT